MDVSHLKNQTPENVLDLRNRKYEDFYFDETQDKYWDTVSGALLSAKAIDGAIPNDQWETREDKRGSGKLIPIKPSITINSPHSGQRVETSTWWPGKEKFINGFYPANEGIIPLAGCRVFNRYRAPKLAPEPEDVGVDMWIEHLESLWPKNEVEHFLDFCAHAVQRPDEKVNHALVLAGRQGLGKDLALTPVRRAVGDWNSGEIEPEAVMGKYNGFMKNVLLVINEVRAAESTNRAFYEAAKTIIATAGETISVEEKFMNPIHIPNLVHVVMTTNNPMSMYIPEDDRRVYLMWSFNDTVFSADYFNNLVKYYQGGGFEAISNFLAKRSLKHFDAGAKPPMTRGKSAVLIKTTETMSDEFGEMMQRYSEEMDDSVIFPKDLMAFVNARAFDDKEELLKKIKSKAFSHRMNELGYVPITNPKGTEWASKSRKFRSRTAYVRRSAYDNSADKIKAALEVRPLAFDEKF